MAHVSLSFLWCVDNVTASSIRTVINSDLPFALTATVTERLEVREGEFV